MSGLKVTKVLTTAALLSALAILLGLFKVPITESVEIRFTMIPIGVAGALLGPGIGGVVGAIADIGGYLVHPTGPFMPLFTLTNVLSGMLYGFILKKNPDSWVRLIVANTLRALLIGIVLNSMIISFLYGSAFVNVLTNVVRVIQQLLTIPVYTLLMKALIPAVLRLYDTQGVAVQGSAEDK
jgi:ECF transporter S component (folate family)